MKNGNKLFFILFTLFICFIGVSSVKAIDPDLKDSKAYTYGIKCIYTGKLKGYAVFNPTASGSAGGDNTTDEPVVFGMDVYCSNDNCTSTRGWGHGRLARLYGSEKVVAGIDNYSVLFGNFDNADRDNKFGLVSGKGLNHCPSFCISTSEVSAAQLTTAQTSIGSAWWGKSDGSRSFRNCLSLTKTTKYSKGNGGDLQGDVLGYANSLKERTCTSNGCHDTTSGALNTADKIDDSYEEDILRIREYEDSESEYNLDNNENLVCSELLGSDLVDIIHKAFLYICFVGVALLVILMSADFVKAITSGDDDALATAFRDSSKRIISTIILLVLPLIVNFILSFINDSLHFETTNGSDKNDTVIKVGNVSDCIKMGGSSS